jgi:hypothetical protein
MNSHAQCKTPVFHNQSYLSSGTMEYLQQISYYDIFTSFKIFLTLSLAITITQIL